VRAESDEIGAEGGESEGENQRGPSQRGRCGGGRIYRPSFCEKKSCVPCRAKKSARYHVTAQNKNRHYSYRWYLAQLDCNALHWSNG
jgi:hypothetical protein